LGDIWTKFGAFFTKLLVTLGRDFPPHKNALAQKDVLEKVSPSKIENAQNRNLSHFSAIDFFNTFLKIIFE
jgi:hypothetical protein